MFSIGSAWFGLGLAVGACDGIIAFSMDLLGLGLGLGLVWVWFSLVWP